MLKRLIRAIRVQFLRIKASAAGWPKQMYVGRAVTVSVSGGGSLEAGEGLDLSDRCVLNVKHGRLMIGSNAFISIGSIVTCRQSITIGDDALIAEYFTAMDQDYCSNVLVVPQLRQGHFAGMLPIENSKPPSIETGRVLLKFLYQWV